MKPIKMFFRALIFLLLGILFFGVKPVNASFTWSSPVPFDQVNNPQIFRNGDDITFSGHVAVTGCGNAAKKADLTFAIKDAQGNWRDLGTWSASVAAEGGNVGDNDDPDIDTDYFKTFTIPNGLLLAGLTDVRISYQLSGGGSTESGSPTKKIRTSDLCPFHGNGNFRFSGMNCRIRCMLKRTNGDISLSDTTIQMDPDSQLIFNRGHSINIGPNTYILKSVSNAVIKKE